MCHTLACMLSTLFVRYGMLVIYASGMVNLVGCALPPFISTSRAAACDQPAEMLRSVRALATPASAEMASVGWLK
jgi:cytochrome c biogenesis protein ResB